MEKGGRMQILKNTMVVKTMSNNNVNRFEIVSYYEKKDINIPRRQTIGSAGYDIECAEDTTIKPNDVVLVPTGLKASIENGMCLLLLARSSLFKRYRLMLPNAVGLIDSDYYNNQNNEGHIYVQLLNIGTEEVLLKKGERIAQAVFSNFGKVVDDNPVDTLRSGGFGSTVDNK